MQRLKTAAAAATLAATASIGLAIPASATTHAPARVAAPVHPQVGQHQQDWHFIVCQGYRYHWKWRNNWFVKVKTLDDWTVWGFTPTCPAGSRMVY